MLSQEKREYFRESLTEKLDELLTIGNKTAHDMTRLNEKCPDPSDRATVVCEQDFNLRMRQRERGLIGKIKEALDRINNGTYGICEECGEDISEARLRARPVATLCIECKRKQEAQERLGGS